ncbi:MAG TPA: TlpA family protein disulfide reductase [Chitinophagaceae bacterium]|nr:TlpA family protein disulfide reductase [Chitinophagaceae bacterium]
MKLVGNGNYFFKCCTVATLLFVSINAALAQAENNAGVIRPLTVGDTLPTAVWARLKNHPPAKKDSNAFHGKLLLIDFWATWCGACIAAFPKLAHLQNEFADSLRILLVTEEPAAVVEQFNQRRAKAGLGAFSLQGITGDTILSRLFPHTYIPHTVWINESGVVKAITESGEVNAVNLRAMMRGIKVPMATKDDAARDLSFDPTKPLFLAGNGGDTVHPIWYAVWSGQVNQVQGALALMRNDSSGGFIQITNAGINTMVRLAYADNPAQFEDMLPAQRVQFSVRDSSRWFPRFSGTRLLSGHLYNYNLVTPPLPDARVRKCMQHDLQRFAGVRASWTRRKLDCLLLTVADTNLLQHAYTGSDSLILHSSSSYHYNSLGNPLPYFVRHLNNSCQLPLLVLDESHYGGLALFSIEADMNNWRSINKALAAYKMQLKKQQRWVRILTVSEE